MCMQGAVWLTASCGPLAEWYPCHNPWLDPTRSFSSVGAARWLMNQHHYCTMLHGVGRCLDFTQAAVRAAAAVAMTTRPPSRIAQTASHGRSVNSTGQAAVASWRLVSDCTNLSLFFFILSLSCLPASQSPSLSLSRARSLSLARSHCMCTAYAHEHK